MSVAADLSRRIALVTGAASGIGLQIARHFQAAGATLVLTDINGEALDAVAETFDAGALTLLHDVGDEAGWHAVVAAIEAAHGRLDILVNNAGVMMAKPFAEAGVEILRRQLRVNVESVYLGMHVALPLLRKARDSSAAIVNISSIYGKVGGAQLPRIAPAKVRSVP